MKWTAWEIIRLLVVVAASMAAGMALLLGFGWLVLTLDKVVKSWQGNTVWEFGYRRVISRELWAGGQLTHSMSQNEAVPRSSHPLR